MSASVNVTDDYVLPVVPKSVEVADKLTAALSQNVLFERLSETGAQAMVNAMESRSVTAGDKVIQQGDKGDFFYVIERGTFAIHVNDTQVATFGDGTDNHSFGELALLYNAPRAATVTATSDGVLWAIARDVFRTVIANAAHDNREHFVAALKHGKLLSQLEPPQLAKVSMARGNLDLVTQKL